MTTWFSGHGWGWCSAMVHTPAMVLLWGAFLTALVPALRSAFTRPSHPAAPTATGTAWRGGSVGAPGTRTTFDDHYYRRLM